MARKNKAVKLAEAIFALLPERDWRKMYGCGDSCKEDIRDWIKDLARHSKCVYSRKRSLMIAREKIESVRDVDRAVARCYIYEMFSKELFKNPENRRTFASFFC